MIYNIVRVVFLLIAIVVSILIILGMLHWSSLIYLIIMYLLQLNLGIWNIRMGYFVQAITHKKKSKNQIAITFDDGPTKYTPLIIELLEQYKAKATFFCVGQQMQQFPDHVQLIVDKGHQISNHTWSHSKKFGFFSTKKVKQEIQQTNQLIKTYTGIDNLYFRPPFGVTNPAIAKAINEEKFKVIGWNIRSLDTMIKNESKILRRIVSRLQPGSIILLHDTSDRTVRVLEQLLKILHHKQYQTVTLQTFLSDEDEK